MKKYTKFLILVMIGLLIVGCTKKEESNKNGEKADAIRFKEDYESINGKSNASGLEHRNLSVNENNPYVFISTKELIEKIKNKETFYVYFGDKQCPWCRSVIEKSIEVANDMKIDKIYYVNIWDDDHNEILRDVYKLNDKGKIEKVSDGSDDYEILLEYFDNVLKNYTLKTDSGKVLEVGEKRIYAPNYIYVKDGEAVKLATGNSELQKDSREELTSEILEDEEKIFRDFFNN